MRATGAPIAVTGVQPLQPPLTHARPDAHTLPHAPQSVSELASKLSQPVDGRLSQSAKPTAQVKPHVLAAHVGVEFIGVVHTVAQALQCAGSALVSVSQPLSA